MIDVNNMRLQFIVDDSGNKTGVLLSLDTFNALIQQIENHAPSGDERQPSNSTTARNSVPIWETIEQLGKAIPNEEWDKVPKDLSANIDHYLYGHAKEKH